MTQAVAVLRECVDAVAGGGSDAHATTLFLGRLRGDIRRDPTPAEAEAAKAAQDAEAARKAAEAAKAAEEARAAAERAAQAQIQGYQPAAGAPVEDSEVPF
jgi:hypothetical protein